jgi:hypothetical protein
MSTNKLMEAAADILSGSKSKAPAMAPQKLDGEVVDLGGPTPQNSKPDDDSNKIHATKAAKSATAPTTKPSDASSKIQTLSQEEFDELSDEEQNMYLEELEAFIISEDFEQLDELSKQTLTNYTKKAKSQLKSMGKTIDTHGKKLPKSVVGSIYRQQMRRDSGIDRAAGKMVGESFSEDINALFADDSTISEEFKSKATTIFEARVFDRVAQIQEQIESEYASMLEEAVETIKQDLAEKVDDYLNYIVEQWIQENEIAIESGLRAELTEDFISGLRNLFAEHYIDVPSEKVDLVEELATKVEELESKLNEEIDRGVHYKKALVESRKQELTREVCSGLTETQVEKIKSLAESVEFSTEEEYLEKLETIRENYFPSGMKKADAEQLHEQVEDDAEVKKPVYDPFVAAVSQAISKTKL